jgi:phospholipase/carboxylesterase
MTAWTDATVQDNVTTVRQSDDSSHLTLTHVGTTYDGSVTEDGHFDTEPTTIKSPEVSYVITITGQFKTNGFSPTVTIEEQRTPRARSCSCQMKWIGTRSDRHGSPDTEGAFARVLCLNHAFGERTGVTSFHGCGRAVGPNGLRHGMSRSLTPRAINRRTFLRVGGSALLLPSSLWGEYGALGATASDGRLTVRPKPPTRRADPGVWPLRLAQGRDGLLQVPARYRKDVPTGLLLMLHGATRSSQESIQICGAPADDAGLILCAPDSRGVTWDIVRGSYGPDVEYIDAALASTFTQCNVDPRRLAIAGFSDGASYALSLGLTNGDLFSHILAFSPGFIGPVSSHGKPPIFISHGTNDVILPIERASRPMVSYLRRRGYTVQFREFTGGHAVPADIAAEAFEWVAGKHG